MDYQERSLYRLTNRSVRKDCVLNLRFLEGGGTTLHYVSGKGNDGAVTLGSGQSSSSFWTVGEFRYAGDYDSGDYVTVTDDVSLELGSEFTIEMLVESAWQTDGRYSYLCEKDGAFRMYYDAKNQPINVDPDWH